MFASRFFDNTRYLNTMKTIDFYRRTLNRLSSIAHTWNALPRSFIPPLPLPTSVTTSTRDKYDEVKGDRDSAT